MRAEARGARARPGLVPEPDSADSGWISSWLSGSRVHGGAAGPGSLPQGRDHGSRFGLPPVRVPGRVDGEAGGGALPGPAVAAARELVLQRRPAVRSRTAPAGTARRVPHPGGGGRGDTGARIPGRRPRAVADDGGVAAPVAGLAGVAARLDEPQLRGARAHVPGPVPGRHPAHGPDGRGRAGHVHRGHPRRDRARAAGERGDAAPDPRHAAGGAERRGPRRADRRQPGPAPGAAQRDAPAAAGMDRGHD
jgi:hypothetical protein